MPDAWDALPDAAAAPQADSWDALPDAGTAPQPSGAGFFSAVRDHVEPVLNAFGQGFREGWGPERWGMSEENVKWLSKVGLYGPSGATKFDNPFQAMNELLGETIARTGELITRGGSGLFRGAQAVVAEAGAQAGQPQLARTIAAIPEAFFGSPHPMGIPKVYPSALHELAAGERAPLMSDYIRARELNVIGTDAPRLSDLPPAEAAARATQPTVAYHASPHDFTAFSSEKIGTGEGHQAYGHGLYFAENDGVARNYFSTFDRDLKTRTIPEDVQAAMRSVDNLGFDTAAEALRALREDMRAGKDYRSIWDLSAPQDAAALARIEDYLAVPFGKANMYQVRIHADKAAFLDWDTPLSQQPKALTVFESLWKDTGEPTENWKGMTAAEAYDRLAKHIGGSGASDAMHEAGIPGIKYLDAGSRDAGEGTRNFVVFSDKDVEITHKNGEPVEPQMTSRRAAAAERTGDDVLRGPEPGGKPSGNPWQDRFDSFVGKLNTPEDVQNLIRDAARDNDGFTQARQGDVPLGQVEKLAEAAGVAPDTVDPRGIGRVMKNDAEVRVGMQTMLTATEAVRDAAREVRSADTPENLIKLQEAMMRRDLAVEQIVGLRAEWGRTGNVFQEFLRDVKDQESLNQFLKDKGRSPTDLRDIADALDKLDGTGAARVLSDMHSKRPGVFYWTWVNGLISGLLTHTKYVAANALYSASEHGVVTPIAAILGKAKQAFGADVERVYFGEAMAASYGMVAAVPNAIFATGKSVWEGKRAVLKSEIELHREAVARGEKVPPVIDRAVNQISGAGRPEFFGDNSNVWGRLTGGDIKGAAKDALGRAIGAPGDMAMGIHTFFKILGERAALEAEAYRGAAKEGLSPAAGDFWRRRSELSENPTGDMQERAIASAYKGTFMNELGPHGRAWQKLTKDTPGLKWLFPFSHIPVNLIKATYEATPLALLDADMRASITGKNGGVAQDRAIARMVAGSAIMGYFVHQALNGRAVGDYPHDPQERDAWKLQGKQPNSVLIGGYWVSFNKFGPAGNLANLGANIAAVIAHLEHKDDDAMAKATFHAASAAAHLVIDEVGFQSLQNIFEAYHDDKKGAAWAASTAASFLPYSSFLGQTASYMDPHMREAKTFIDGIKNKIPAQRETLLPKRDWLGQPVPNPQYGNIIRQRQAITDPLSMAMDRLQIHPGLPADRIGGVKLPRPLYDEYQTLAGAYTQTALESLVNAPGWSDLPPYVQINAIHANIRSSRQVAEATMQVKHPELIGLGMQQRVDFITGKALTARPKKAPAELTR